MDGVISGSTALSLCLVILGAVTTSFIQTFQVCRDITDNIGGKIMNVTSSKDAQAIFADLAEVNGSDIYKYIQMYALNNIKIVLRDGTTLVNEYDDRGRLAEIYKDVDGKFRELVSKYASTKFEVSTDLTIPNLVVLTEIEEETEDGGD